MSLNVIKEFINFDKNRINDIARIVLGKYYNKPVFNTLLDTYISIRYYDAFGDIKSGKTIGVINNYLTKCGQNLTTSNQDIIKYSLTFFGFVYYFDGVSSRFNNKEILIKVNNFRTTKLGLNNLDEKNFLKLLEGYEKKFNKFKEEIQDKNYNVNYVKSNLNEVWWCDLISSLKIPDLYSESSIKNVYDNGIIYENRLFITYYMVSLKVLCDIINLKYNNYYLVNFGESLLKKEDKLGRLLYIINDDILKERIIIMINQNIFNKYKEKIYELINSGYSFGLIVDSEDNNTLFPVFKYIYYSNKNEVKKV